MLRSLVAVLGLLFASIALGFEPSTVTITLENKSTKAFEFEEVELNFPGNKVTIAPQLLNPGAKATVTGTITKDFDLYATIIFKNQAKFTISDRRQFHTGQPIFSMRGGGVRSEVVTKTRNPKRGGRLLA